LPGPVVFALLISALNSTLKPAFFEAAKAGMFPAPRGNSSRRLVAVALTHPVHLK
jgi:hypothetical protein